jgi:hypothetical protein
VLLLIEMDSNDESESEGSVEFDQQPKQDHSTATAPKATILTELMKNKTNMSGNSNARVSASKPRLVLKSDTENSEEEDTAHNSSKKKKPKLVEPTKREKKPSTIESSAPRGAVSTSHVAISVDSEGEEDDLRGKESIRISSLTGKAPACIKWACDNNKATIEDIESSIKSRVSTLDAGIDLLKRVGPQSFDDIQFNRTLYSTAAQIVSQIFEINKYFTENRIFLNWREAIRADDEGDDEDEDEEL